MADRKAPIGVFDSGVGGLTVAREIMRQIPEERIVYFGDTARVPYGSKSRDTIIKYSRQIIRFLKTQGVKAIVVACNTASAVALEDVRKELDIPIIGVIKAGARTAAAATHNGRIGIIATETTINSKVYTHFLEELNPGLCVIGKACPLFVPLVEEGTFLKDPITEEIASRYLQELKEKQVNPAYETARELKALLIEEGIGNTSLQEGQEQTHTFYVSDATEKFQQFAESILPCSVKDTTQINIEEY